MEEWFPGCGLNFRLGGILKGQMTKRRRICIRLDELQLDAIKAIGEREQTELSTVVRKALIAFSGSNVMSDHDLAPNGRVSMPPQAERLMGRYLAWGRGDLREERKRLFCELLAAAYVCKKTYPRTPGIPEGFEGLLELCRYFGFNDV